MRRHASHIICVIFLLFSASGMASIPESIGEQHQTGVFGIIVSNPQGKKTFKVTNVVPFVEGQGYGWIIKLGAKFEKVKWTEVLRLPAEPRTWGRRQSHGEYQISDDRKVSVTEQEVAAKDGYIENFWSVAPGDPLGDYVIQVYVNGLLLKTFHFKVVKR